MTPMEAFQALLLDEIRKEDVSHKIPSHDAFEVEDLKIRKNYTFILNRDHGAVTLLDTSIGREPITLQIFTKPFPFAASGAEDYFVSMYRKSLRAVDDIMFLGYVHPETLEPLED